MLVIICEIWLIQIAEIRLLCSSQNSLIQSAKTNWFDSEKYFSQMNQWNLTDLTVKI